MMTLAGRPIRLWMCSLMSCIPIAVAGCGTILGIDDPTRDPAGSADGGDPSGDGGNNRSPMIVSIELTPPTPGAALISTMVDVTCVANDPDNDTLTFAISTDIGTIVDPSRADTIWIPDQREGVATITCQVDDGNGGTDTGTAMSAVTVDPNQIVTQLPFQGTLVDASGNNNDAGFTGNPLFTPDRLGNQDSALLFTGIDPTSLEGKGGLLNEPAYDLAEFSIAMWVRLDQTAAGDQVLVSKTPDGLSSPGNFTLVVAGTGGPDGSQVRYAHATAAGTVSLLASPSALQIGQYAHVAVVVAPPNVRTFFNGIVSTTATTGTVSINNFGAGLGGVNDAGGFPVGGYFGAMDDLRIYRRALSDAEITAIARGDTL